MEIEGNQHMKPKNFAIIFSAGVLTGVLAWQLGSSAIPTYLLKILSGIGYFRLVTVILACTFLGYAWYMKQSPNCLAMFFTNRALKGLLKPPCFMSGVGLVAIFCWYCTNSKYALGSAIYCLILGEQVRK